MKLKIQFKKYLIAAIIGLLAINIAIGIKTLTAKPDEAFKYVERHEALDSNEYTISQEMLLSKLKEKSQIVSMEQSISKKDVNVDKGFLGERKTELSLNGKFKLGLETKEIKIREIDSDKGIVYMSIPKPVIISLDLPFDKTEFEKTDGWFRMSMSEEDEKRFFKSAKKNIENEILKDKEIMSQANTYNEKAIEGILTMLPAVKTVVFE